MPLVGGIPAPPSKGSQATDGQHLIVEPEDYQVVEQDPIAIRFLRPYVQARELLHNVARWCLWLDDVTPTEITGSPILQERLSAVAFFRQNSATESVRQAANTPALFTQRRQPTSRYLATPIVSSESRRYVPMAYLEPDVIGGSGLLLLPDAPLWLFGILQSSMWMAWVRTVVGRLKSDLRIAPDIAYSAFPWPDLTEAHKERLAAAAQGVITARDQFPEASLADLYDPLAMPAELTRAHNTLDRAVDRAYGRHRHGGDETRLPVLLRRYVELTGGDLTLFDDDPETIG